MSSRVTRKQSYMAKADTLASRQFYSRETVIYPYPYSGEPQYMPLWVAQHTMQEKTSKANSEERNYNNVVKHMKLNLDYLYTEDSKRQYYDATLGWNIDTNTTPTDIIDLLKPEVPKTGDSNDRGEFQRYVNHGNNLVGVQEGAAYTVAEYLTTFSNYVPDNTWPETVIGAFSIPYARTQVYSTIRMDDAYGGPLSGPLTYAGLTYKINGDTVTVTMYNAKGILSFFKTVKGESEAIPIVPTYSIVKSWF